MTSPPRARQQPRRGDACGGCRRRGPRTAASFGRSDGARGANSSLSPTSGAAREPYPIENVAVPHSARPIAASARIPPGSHRGVERRRSRASARPRQPIGEKRAARSTRRGDATSSLSSDRFVCALSPAACRPRRRRSAVKSPNKRAGPARRDGYPRVRGARSARAWPRARPWRLRRRRGEADRAGRAHACAPGSVLFRVQRRRAQSPVRGDASRGRARGRARDDAPPPARARVARELGRGKTSAKTFHRALAPRAGEGEGCCKNKDETGGDAALASPRRRCGTPSPRALPPASRLASPGDAHGANRRRARPPRTRIRDWPPSRPGPTELAQGVLRCSAPRRPGLRRDEHGAGPSSGDAARRGVFRARGRRVRRRPERDCRLRRRVDTVTLFAVPGERFLGKTKKKKRLSLKSSLVGRDGVRSRRARAETTTTTTTGATTRRRRSARREEEDVAALPSAALGVGVPRNATLLRTDSHPLSAARPPFQRALDRLGGVDTRRFGRSS